MLRNQHTKLERLPKELRGYVRLVDAMLSQSIKDIKRPVPDLESPSQKQLGDLNRQDRCRQGGFNWIFAPDDESPLSFRNFISYLDRDLLVLLLELIRLNRVNKEKFKSLYLEKYMKECFHKGRRKYCKRNRKKKLDKQLDV